jgi:hypothetical protein
VVAHLQPHTTDQSHMFRSAMRGYRFFNTLSWLCSWQVANKAIELLMSNDGQEVCCQGADDVRRLETLGTAKSREAEVDAP